MKLAPQQLIQLDLNESELIFCMDLFQGDFLLCTVMMMMMMMMMMMNHHLGSLHFPNHLKQI